MVVVVVVVAVAVAVVVVVVVVALVVAVAAAVVVAAVPEEKPNNVSIVRRVYRCACEAQPLADVGGLELLGYSGKPESLDGICHPWSRAVLKHCMSRTSVPWIHVD